MNPMHSSGIASSATSCSTRLHSARILATSNSSSNEERCARNPSGTLNTFLLTDRYVVSHPAGSMHQIKDTPNSDNGHTKHKVDPYPGQLSRTLCFHERSSFNTKDGEQKCPDLRLLGWMVGENWSVIFQNVFVMGKEKNVGDNLAMLAHRFVRTHMWSGPKLATGHTVYRCRFPSMSCRWPAGLHDNRAGHF